MSDRPPAPVSQPPRTSLADVRCAQCGHLLFRAAAAGRVEIVCANRECRRYQIIRLPMDRRGV